MWHVQRPMRHQGVLLGVLGEEFSHAVGAAKRKALFCSVCCADQSLGRQHFAIVEAASPRTNLTPWEATKRDGKDQFLHVPGGAAKSSQPCSWALPTLPIAIERSFISVFFLLSRASIGKLLFTSENETWNRDPKATISFILLYVLATNTAMLTHMASQLC